MNLCLRIVFVKICLLLYVVLPAQVGLFMPNFNNAVPGGTVLIPIKVLHFDSIAAAQFVIRWDSTVLRYKSITNYSALGLTLPVNFNLNNALDSGLIRFQWVSSSSCPGTTLTDSTVIFKIRFDVIGPVSSGTSIKFASAYPTLFEITQVKTNCTTKSYPIDSVYLHQSFVAVGYTVGTAEADANPLHAAVSPNPFSDRTHVSFDLEKPEDVRMQLMDAAGRICYEQVMNRLSAGPHDAYIDAAMLNGKKGTYFLVLRTATQVSVRSFLML
jgi:hypothetical protein